MDQFLHIVKLIVITVDAFPVIDNPILFIPLQTVQQRILAITSGKQRERIGLGKLSPFKVALTPLQCIHYCLTRPGVVSVMAGCHNCEELMTNLAYESADTKDKDFAEVLANVPKHSFKGNCVYCGHCAPCVKGINVAEVNKYTDLCKAQNEVPETVREHYKALKHHASECIACGLCEKNCPFEVEIIKKMQEAVKIFGY